MNNIKMNNIKMNNIKMNNMKAFAKYLANCSDRDTISAAHMAPFSSHVHGLHEDWREHMKALGFDGVELEIYSGDKHEATARGLALGKACQMALTIMDERDREADPVKMVAYLKDVIKRAHEELNGYYGSDWEIAMQYCNETLEEVYGPEDKA